MVSQPRFLLFPWVQVDNLASHALSLAVRQLPQDWQRRYGSWPVLIETFVDPERFGGVCYRVANWLRLVFAPRRQGYTATLAELWDHWHGHRVFAVDGSKLTLPRPLRAAGYPLPNEQAHYPQGLLSCLYRLHSKLPVDFDLHAHGDERAAALAHLRALAPSDLLVYDRGYYSFELLCAHRQRRLQAVFRIRRKAGHALDRFIASDLTDTITEIFPGPDALRELCCKHPRRRKCWPTWTKRVRFRTRSCLATACIP